jgi:hypothetical protein
MYFNVMLPENNPGWHQKCFYVKDQPTSSRKIGLEELGEAILGNPLSAKEMMITKLLMQKIQELCSTPGKEVTVFQLIRLFIECWYNP